MSTRKTPCTPCPLALLLCLGVVESLLAGCGSDGSDAAAAAGGAGASPDTGADSGLEASAETSTDGNPISDAPADSPSVDAADDSPPPLIAQTSFGAFEPWAKPIADYIAVGWNMFGDFERGIHDLAPHGDRLWLAYGDGTLNLGEYIPIEFRFFASPGDPTAVGAVVDGAGQGAPQSTPLQSGEEQIDRYRVLGGALWQAGVDSIDADELHTQQNTNPKGIEGNVYRLAAGSWKKLRTIKGGEHVHDIALWKGDLFAVGSGADLRTEFESGQIFRYLWRSKDNGASFETVQRIQHPDPEKGDSRWVHLLATTSALLLFGYQSDFATGKALIRNAVYDGQSVADMAAASPMQKVFPHGTQAFEDGTGLVWGTDAASSPMRNRVWHVKGDGTAETIASLAGKTLVDASLCPATGEVLLLAHDDDAVSADPSPFRVTVFVAPIAQPGAVTERVAFETTVRPRSIAWWKGALFYGNDAGEVWKAKPAK
jgi:hypothetical protein